MIVRRSGWASSASRRPLPASTLPRPGAHSGCIIATSANTASATAAHGSYHWASQSATSLAAGQMEQLAGGQPIMDLRASFAAATATPREGKLHGICAARDALGAPHQPRSMPSVAPLTGACHTHGCWHSSCVPASSCHHTGCRCHLRSAGSGAARCLSSGQRTG
jgi:hypothetical protein